MVDYMKHTHLSDPQATILFSKRNTVLRITKDARCVIQKQFASSSALQWEAHCYAVAQESQITVPDIIEQTSDALYLSYIPGPTALELLEQNEQRGHISVSDWKNLVQWCCKFYTKTKLCLGDPNLRNFILHEDTQRWYGIDFEACCPGNQHQDFAQLLSFLLLYDPIDTPIKQALVQILSLEYCQRTDISQDMLYCLLKEERLKLIHRRQRKTEVCI